MGGQQPNFYGGGGLGTGMSNSLYGQQPQQQMGAYMPRNGSPSY
jgi:hypothetical protein